MNPHLESYRNAFWYAPEIQQPGRATPQAARRVAVLGAALRHRFFGRDHRAPCRSDFGHRLGRHPGEIIIAFTEILNSDDLIMQTHHAWESPAADVAWWRLSRPLPSRSRQLRLLDEDQAVHSARPLRRRRGSHETHDYRHPPAVPLSSLRLHLGRHYRPRQSGLTLAARITLAHFSVSAATKRANSAGEVENGS
jgi:hypothetical protein